MENEMKILNRETLLDNIKGGADLNGARGVGVFQCGKSNRISLAIKWEEEIMFKIGCFWGGSEKAILEVREKYGENSYYEILIKLYTKMLEEEGK